MKHYAVLTLLYLCTLTYNYASNLPSFLLKEIKATEQNYSQRDVFDKIKLERIKTLENKLLLQTEALNTTQQYALNKELFKELYSFKSQEAFNVAVRMERLARHIKSRDKQLEALLYKTDVLLCAGLFSEAMNLILQVNETPTRALKVYYYSLLTRLYGDLMTYNNIPQYHERYQQLNQLYADSLLQFATVNSVEYQMVLALKLIDSGQAQKALAQCKQFTEQPEISEHQKAMVYSCMAWGYNQLGNLKGQVQYLLKSIEADICSSTYETTSGRLLAQLLLENGEIRLAHQFLIRAIEDAEFYGARQRKAEITHIVPIVELQLKELQQLRLQAISSVLIIILLSLIVIIYLWIRLIHRHREVKNGRDKINRQNNLLAKQNEQLTESNKIKEESLTNYFELSSVYFHEIEKMQAKIRSLLLQKKYDSIANYLSQSGAHEDKERLYERFDSLFLKLFPTFINAINVVLDQSMRLDETSSPRCLSAEIRVFALLRLGITGADRVASILGISRNTVYTYRNRIKTKVNINPDEFEQYVMNIPSC